MKASIWFFWCGLTLSLSACNEEDTTSVKEIDVESYIELLKGGRYESNQLPDFTPDDIPVLLGYTKETDIISVFPRNPVSSLHQEGCELGILVLWTIESIRAVSIQSEQLFMSFPSSNPILKMRNTGELELIPNNTILKEASNAYLDWWQKNKDKVFEEFHEVDPLAVTQYAWH